jgi:hypothetical protein
MSLTPSRIRFAVRWASGHLAVSAAVAVLSALLVFGLWYPNPWRQMLGVSGIFGLVLAVDVVCGPLLTLLLANPHKSRGERWVDLSLVAVIQLAALGYGLWSVFQARPVVLAFEVDRLVVVTANEVQIEQLPEAMPGLRSLPWGGVRLTGLRKARTSQEYLESIDQSMQGVSQAMRPGWWRPYEEVRPEVAQRAKSLALLMESRPELRDVLEKAVAQTKLSSASLRYLPLTSGKTSDWIALINEEGDMVGHAEVDGFD